ncbi:ABC transporter substrate-binding protein [Variovorax sp. J31P207]|uniref:ABC transporter substrate-binding protein n=1 Tax=Variovorax sp. J31P207 TaxID=3053510 RepID=UPI002574F57A|nr:ABC transporter substrate-binding protein [Variovorax sp. J31P207]MDM0071426.1 ABC transporter substrate-binding protein [Variovorax sp. J31P207]
MNFHTLLTSTVVILLGFAQVPAHAQKNYGPGVTDTEIKIGNTAAYSGPASVYSVGAKAIKSYFDKINDEGGINGRKLNFISLDDGFNPAKTVEQTRKLVEVDQVLMVVQPLGTAPVTAVHKYMNSKKVPQLFVGSGASKWGDPRNYPWTMGFIPDYVTEAKIVAKYIAKHKPDGKIGVLYQNDDLGRDFNRGLAEGLGARAATMLVAKVSYEITDPTVDSQIVALKDAGVDVLVTAALGKFASQSIKKVNELGWRPMHYLINASSSVGSVLKPAGLGNSVGIISSSYMKDPSDPQWQKTKELEDYMAWMKRYYPAADPNDWLVAWGYSAAQATVEVVRKAGNELTRENIMKQAANLDLALPMLLPGIRVKTSPDDYFPIDQMKIMTFNGTTWELAGEIFQR